MRVWTIFWAVVVAVLVVFAFANWGIMNAPTTISLVCGRHRASKD